jgi:folate-binding protein YgfZ
MFEQRFLKEIGAIVRDDGHVAFADFDPAADPCPGSFITPVPGFSLLQLSGGDAAEFLHNQLTSDIRRLSDGAGGPTAWCNPKGRVITTFVIYRLDDVFFLLLPAVLQERVTKRLQMFVLRSDVRITDFTAGRSLLGVRGRAGAIPDVEHEFSIHELNERLHLFLPDRLGESRCLIVDQTAALQALWPELASSIPPVDSRCWNRLDMESGLPWLAGTTSEQFLPQELNLDEIGVVSFDKGCYPGQEVIARVRYRGQVKRRLYLAHCEANGAPQPGANLRDTDGKNAGMIISAVPDAGKGYIIQAVVDTSSLEAGGISIENGPLLHIESGMY